MIKRKILLITDYQDRFGTRYLAKPYRSGFDRNLVSRYFGERGYDTEFITPSGLWNSGRDFRSYHILYTSAEDKDARYRSFLEDILLGLSNEGASIVPSFQYLRAHNNKVFFEIMRRSAGLQEKVPGILESKVFGSYEELEREKHIEFPVVLKSAAGYKGRGVFLASSESELKQYAKKAGRSKSLYNELKDFLRKFRHKGFRPESRFRNKFITQDFIPGLSNDYKVLVYLDRYYVLFRETRDNDFRASGSGKFSYPDDIPHALLDYSKKLFESFDVPHASFDIADDGTEFYLLEAQFVYFGTYTLEHSDVWYQIDENGKWIELAGKSVLEEGYCKSVVDYIERKSPVKE